MNNTGFISGYRWGVEYPTNGSKPDLPDDVIIQLSAPMCRGSLSVFAGSAMCAAKGATFKIIDERYKPEDTSYLDEYFAVQGIDQQKIKNTLISDIAERGWYCYETQKALRLPPVGDKSVSYLAGDGVWIGCEVAAHYKSGAIVAHNCGVTLVCKHELRPNNFHARKAEAERERVVDAVFEFTYDEDNDYPTWNELAALYDAGFLRMPGDK
jgi:hypothetical protein